MTHPLVTQLRFTRSEFKRAVKGVSDEDAAQRILPMNCISWNVGHLTWQEQRYFLLYGQQRDLLLPEIDKQFAYGCPPSTPSLKAMLKAWTQITEAVDPWLDTVTNEVLSSHVMKADGTPSERIVGNLLQRVIYHYWYHIGENMAIRQMLGHNHLGVFVGNIDDKASFVVS